MENWGSIVNIFAGLFMEAAVVGIVCVIFLILFIVAGVKQIFSDTNRD